MNKIKVVKLDVADLQPTVAEVPDTVESFQHIIGGCFDVISPAHYLPQELDGLKMAEVIKKYDIYCDDEGLVKKSLLNITLNPFELKRKNYDYAGLIFGNIFVAGSDKEGNTASVADEDIKHIMMFLRYVFYFNKARIESFKKALK